MCARIREEALLAAFGLVLWMRRRWARRKVCLVISGRSRCRWSCSDGWAWDVADSSSEEQRSTAFWLGCRDGEEIRISVSAARGRPTGWNESWVCTELLVVNGSPEPQAVNIFCILPVQRAMMMTRRKCGMMSLIRWRSSHLNEAGFGWKSWT